MKTILNACITFPLMLLCFLSINSGAQTPNPCGVIAKISPGTADSVLPANSIVQFTSVSENATSYRWLYQGFGSGISNTPWNYSTSVGVQTIGLVATNGNCSDTTTVVYFSPGTPHDISNSLIANYGNSRANDYAEAISGTADGSFIMGGDHYLSGWCGTEGLIVKTRDRGCIDWSRTVIDVTPVFCKNATVNGVHGGLDSNYYISANLGTVTIKLDKNGNLVWRNRWEINGLSSIYLNSSEMTSDPSGNLYILSRAFSQGMMISKINAAGDFVWAKYYRLSPYSNNDPFGNPYVFPRGLAWLNNKIYVGGNRTAVNGVFNDNFLLQIDATTGQTGWQHSYSTSASSGWVFTQVRSFGNLLLVAGQSNGQWATIIDEQGNVRKNIWVNFPNSNYAPQKTSAEADGKGNIYLMQWVKETLNLQPGYANYTNFARIDTTLNKYWGVTYSTTPGGGYFVGSAMNNKNSYGAIAQDIGLVGESSGVSWDFRFLKVDSTFNTRINFGCGYDVPFSVTAMPADRQDFQWNADSVIGATRQTVTNISIAETYIQSRYTCPDFVDSCSYMKLTGPSTICNPTPTYTYKLIRNKKCALLPQWELSAGVSIVNQTDSSIVLQFPSFGEYKLAAKLNGCVPLKDSLMISIQAKYQLDLGKDTSICNNAPITLRASPVFTNYSWDNGSTDSLITVTQPGIYWVEVIDSCGNRLRDSIQISNFNFPISIGPDRSKCNIDTLHLNAPAGFLNYQWSNNYNISSTNTQSVVVNPPIDTAYYLKAEKLPGCFSYDTVRITVHHSPLIRLGSDTSFCLGNNVTFDAGAGFFQYQWSTGTSTQTITVNNTGKFSVIGTTTQACKSYDTVSVLNIWPLPIVSIKGDPTLCEGGTRLLDAGSFPGGNYLWNDGNRTQTITINSLGNYSVQVTDQKGCMSNDSFFVDKMARNPEKFLPLDTSICSYGKLELLPKSPFENYLWSTGAGSRSITISKAGTYWLQVMDNNKCIGRDTINVKQKDCLRGLFVPNAFTPNNNKKNDVFKALLFGNVQSFEFSVFNRWGQLVFRTTDPNKGWDGNIQGSSQSTGLFVWVCKYQLDDDRVKVERGTVTLIR